MRDDKETTNSTENDMKINFIENDAIAKQSHLVMIITDANCNTVAQVAPPAHGWTKEAIVHAAQKRPHGNGDIFLGVTWVAEILDAVAA
jgi:IS5 family transposase